MEERESDLEEEEDRVLASEVLQRRMLRARQKLAFQGHVSRSRSRSPQKQRIDFHAFQRQDTWNTKVHDESSYNLPTTNPFPLVTESTKERGRQRFRTPERFVQEVEEEEKKQKAAANKTKRTTKRKSAMTLSVMRVRYNSMTPATRQYMFNALSRVDQILHLLMVKRKSCMFTLWKCQTLFLSFQRRRTQVAQETKERRDIIHQIDTAEAIFRRTNDNRVKRMIETLKKVFTADIATAFRRWHHVTFDEPCKTQLLGRAIRRLKNGLVFQGFYKWKTLGEQDYRDARTGVMRRVISRCKNRLLARAFRQWQLMSSHRRQDYLLARRVFGRMRNRFLFRGFARWKETICTERHRSKVIGRVLSRLYNKALFRAFATWRVSNAANHRNSELLRRVVRRMLHWQLYRSFQTWKLHLSRVSAERVSQTTTRLRGILLKRTLLRFSHLSLATSFSTWKKFTRESAFLALNQTHQLRVLRRIASVAHDKNLQTAFFLWKLSAREQAFRATQLQTHGQYLSRVILRILHRSTSAAFTTWKQHCNSQQLKAALLVRAASRWKRALIGDAFQLWRRETYLTSCKHLVLRILAGKKRKVELSQGFHHWQLVSHGAGQHKSASHGASRKLILKLIHKSQHRAFNKWKSFVHASQRQEGTGRLQTLFRCWTQWRVFLVQENNERLLAERNSSQLASAGRRMLCMWTKRKQAKYFLRWKHISRTSTNLERFLRRVLFSKQAKAFARWKDLYLEDVELKHRERIVLHTILRMKRSSLERCFLAWKSYWRNCVEVRIQEASRDQHHETLSRVFEISHNRRLVFKLFGRWKDEWKTNQKRKEIIRKWIRNTVHRKMHGAWTKWRQACELVSQARRFTLQLQSQMEKIQSLELEKEQARTRVANHIICKMQNRTLDLAFQSWKEFVRIRLLLRRTIESMRGTMIKDVFSAWKHFAKDSITKRLRKILRKWSSFAASRAQVKQYMAHARRFRVQARVFQGWKASLERENTSLRVICMFWRKARLRQAFLLLAQLWRRKTVQCLNAEISILARHQGLFFRARLVSKYFSIWRRFHSIQSHVQLLRNRKRSRALERLRENALRARAVRTLQWKGETRTVHRMFFAWCDLVHENKRLRKMRASRDHMRVRSTFHKWAESIQSRKRWKYGITVSCSLLRSIIERVSLRLSRWAFNQLRRHWSISRGLRKVAWWTERLEFSRKRYGFSRFIHFALCSEVVRLSAQHRTLSKTRKQYAKEIVSIRQTLARKEKKLAEYKEKLDRFLCRRRPQTYREQVAEERFYNRRGGSAGRPAAVHLRVVDSNKSHYTPKKTSRTLSPKFAVASAPPNAWIPSPSSSPRHSISQTERRRRRKPGFFSEEPRGKQFGLDQEEEEILVLSESEGDGGGNSDLDELMVSLRGYRGRQNTSVDSSARLVDGERKLKELESSLIDEVKDLSNSFQYVNQAASSARLSGLAESFHERHFEPALEGLASRLRTKEQQLRFLEEAQQSIDQQLRDEED